MTRLTLLAAAAILVSCSEADEPQRADDTTDEDDDSSTPVTITPVGDDDDDSSDPASDDDDSEDDDSEDDDSESGSTAADGGASESDGGTTNGAEADAGTDSSPPSEPAQVGDFVLLCDDRNAETTGPEFKYYLYLVNKTEEPVPLSELTVRYFFTEDVAAMGHEVYIDYAGPDVISAANVTSAVAELTPAQPTADRYVQLGFNSGELQATPDTDPGLDQRVIQLRVQVQPAALRYDLTNDYSYTPMGDGTPCERIVMYRNGVIVFGVQPDGETIPAPPEPVDGGVTHDAGAGDAGSAVDASLGAADAG